MGTKFKAMSLDSKEWFFGNEIVSRNGITVILSNGHKEEKCVESTLCRLTSEKDRKGRDIYENDVINIRSIHKKGIIKLDDKENVRVVSNIDPNYIYNPSVIKISEVISNSFEYKYNGLDAVEGSAERLQNRRFYALGKVGRLHDVAIDEGGKISFLLLFDNNDAKWVLADAIEKISD